MSTFSTASVVSIFWPDTVTCSRLALELYPALSSQQQCQTSADGPNPLSRINTYCNTHTRLTALCPGLPRCAGTRKVKPIWILLKQETVSGSDISWAICKSAPRSRQITRLAPHRSDFTGRMPFLPPNQQRQSIEGTLTTNQKM